MAFWKIGLHMVCTSILHLLCTQSRKVFFWVRNNWNILNLEYLEGMPIRHKILSSRITCACIDLLQSFEDLQKKLALSCNKTWDHGRREVRSLSSSNTYAKKQVVLIKQIQIKINKAKFTLYLLTSRGRCRLPDSVLVINYFFHTRFEWFQRKNKVNS